MDDNKQRSAVEGKSSSLPRIIVALVAMWAITVAAQLAVAQSKKVSRLANRVTENYSGKTHKLIPALKLARSSQAALLKVKGYEGTFSKRELVGRSMSVQTMKVKIREEPFSVYLRYINPHEGREVIWVDGKNDGKLLAHGAGIESIVGTLKIDPTSKDAMEENRYPVTLIGMGNMLLKTIEQWEAELDHGEVTVNYYPNAKIGGVECKVIQTSHPVRRKHFRFHLTRLYIDKQNNLPIRVEQFDFPSSAGKKPKLVEEYTYSNLKTSVKLTDQDFDISNPNYDY